MESLWNSIYEFNSFLERITLHAHLPVLYIYWIDMARYRGMRIELIALVTSSKKIQSNSRRTSNLVVAKWVCLERYLTYWNTMIGDFINSLLVWHKGVSPHMHMKTVGTWVTQGTVVTVGTVGENIPLFPVLFLFPLFLLFTMILMFPYVLTVSTILYSRSHCCMCYSCSNVFFCMCGHSYLYYQ